jgi:hypothetical protein
MRGPKPAPRYPVIYKTSKKEKKSKTPPLPEVNWLLFLIGSVFLSAEPGISWLCSGYFCLNIKFKSNGWFGSIWMNSSTKPTTQRSLPLWKMCSSEGRLLSCLLIAARRLLKPVRAFLIRFCLTGKLTGEPIDNNQL